MHRFLVATLLAAIALLAPAAVTAQGFPQVPADAQAIGSPTPTGEQLLAWMRAGHLCAVMKDPKFGDPLVGPARNCPRPPVLTPLGHATLSGDRPPFPRGTPTSDPAVVYGVVGADIAAVQLAARDRVVSAAPVIAGQGPLTGIRFFIVAAPSEHPVPTELHFLDAAGAVRRAEEITTLSSFDPFPVPGSTHTVARGGHGQRAWRIEAYRERHLQPTPLEPLRRAESQCVTFVLGGHPSSNCDPLDGLGTMDVRFGCSARGTPLVFLARPGIRSVVTVLGDGRRTTTRLVPVATGTSGMSAGVTWVRNDQAIRRVLGLDDAGHRVASVSLRRAPSVALCTTHARADELTGGETTSQGRPAAPAGAAVVATDSGAELCIGLAGWTHGRTWCALPPVEPGDTRIHATPAGALHTVVGLVPLDVASVVLTLDDDRTVRVTPAPLPAEYHGRYAAVTRLLRIDLPARRRVMAFTLRDAAGRGLLTLPTLDEAPPSPQVVAPVMHAPSLPPLVSSIYEYSGRPIVPVHVKVGCLTLGKPSVARCLPAMRRFFQAVVPCAPRRIVIYGYTGGRRDRLSLETADRRTIAGVTVALPPTFTRTVSAMERVTYSRAALLVAPADAQPTRLVLRGGPRTHAAPLRLPPAAQQCGYTMPVDLTDAPQLP